jgi:hypothetical protein
MFIISCEGLTLNVMNRTILFLRSTATTIDLSNTAILILCKLHTLSFFSVYKHFLLFTAGKIKYTPPYTSLNINTLLGCKQTAAIKITSLLCCIG